MTDNRELKKRAIRDIREQLNRVQSSAASLAPAEKYRYKREFDKVLESLFSQLDNQNRMAQQVLPPKSQRVKTRQPIRSASR